MSTNLVLPNHLKAFYKDFYTSSDWNKGTTCYYPLQRVAYCVEYVEFLKDNNMWLAIEKFWEICTYFNSFCPQKEFQENDKNSLKYVEIICKTAMAHVRSTYEFAITKLNPSQQF